MDIDDMTACPELDRLVAEKVMGWHADERGIWWLDAQSNRCGSQEFPAALPAIVGTKVIDGATSSDGGRRCVFSPSTNIAHAWEVVEFFGGITLEGGPKSGWHAFWTTGGPSPERAKGATAPLAICRLFLKVVSP